MGYVLKKAKKDRKSKAPRQPGAMTRWWVGLGSDGQRSILVGLLTALCVAAVCSAAVVGLGRLHRYVMSRPAFAGSRAEVVLVDQPAWMTRRQTSVIRAGLLDPAQESDWTFDETLARRVHEAASACPWIRELHEVRVVRDAPAAGGAGYAGRVLVRATWREPVAIACWSGPSGPVEEYVDAYGYVLPRDQVGDMPLPRITGLRHGPPPELAAADRAGRPVAARWPGEDLQSGLIMLSCIHDRAYSANELEAVDVSQRLPGLREPDVTLVFGYRAADGQFARTRVLVGQLGLDGAPPTQEPSLQRKIRYLDWLYRQNRYTMAGLGEVNLLHDEGPSIPDDTQIGAR